MLCLPQLGLTPLHFAAQSCSEDVVKMMIEERGADIHAVDEVRPYIIQCPVNSLKLLKCRMHALIK